MLETTYIKFCYYYSCIFQFQKARIQKMCEEMLNVPYKLAIPDRRVHFLLADEQRALTCYIPKVIASEPKYSEGPNFISSNSTSR